MSDSPFIIGLILSWVHRTSLDMYMLLVVIELVAEFNARIIALDQY